MWLMAVIDMLGMDRLNGCPQHRHLTARKTNTAMSHLLTSDDFSWSRRFFRDLSDLPCNDPGHVPGLEDYLPYGDALELSDVLHQPLYDLIHSEDRDDIRQQLNLAYSLPPGSTNPQDLYEQENSQHLERNVNARFRCLLDSTCGFLPLQEFSLPLPPPLPCDIPPWAPDPWTGELYPHYNSP
ncbi:hypothetical protein TELCIR_17881, partial [Teladorsagia circumcincta]